MHIISIALMLYSPAAYAGGGPFQQVSTLFLLDRTGRPCS